MNKKEALFNDKAWVICAFHKRKFGRTTKTLFIILFCQIESCHNRAEFFGFKTTLEITGVEL